MIATLLSVPKTSADWQIFGFAHAQVHAQIRQALLTKKNYMVGDYILDPISFGDLEAWLARVQQTHLEMNQALNLTGGSLEGADLTDPNQTAAWIYLNWQEDNAAMEALQL